ncbi:YjdF family protein [Paenibacillus sp.]|jgi:hypothetical protein|uniref:YjdF family protein n=1 Tax=Paenibacillus sp. TaxID=58172 RepID=UPI00282C0F2B|nr:YjdF family protein [Paenibacillus sp.]MDR0267109.1 YjdF family protein [Paenibacillus sp.]
MKLTVFFDDPYWVGVVEVESEGKVMAGKHTFGAEPSLQQVWEFVQRELPTLVERLSIGVTANKAQRRAVNPKRMARLAARESRARGVNSASQEAMRLELEKRKKERPRLSKEQREALAVRKREIAVQKAKAKHRGR